MDYWKLSWDYHGNDRLKGAAVDGEELVGRLGMGLCSGSLKRETIKPEIARGSKRQ